VADWERQGRAGPAAVGSDPVVGREAVAEGCRGVCTPVQSPELTRLPRRPMKTPAVHADDTQPEPPRIRQISAPELKAMIESGVSIELVDVRTEEERGIARIAGSRLLDQEYYKYLLGLDRGTPLVFQCHHGIRSQSAAEYCLLQGFRNLYNLRGGIDAWSQLVDPTVPRY
jgi:rhodanese-related sulfurtransferase